MFAHDDDDDENDDDDDGNGSVPCPAPSLRARRLGSAVEGGVPLVFFDLEATGLIQLGVLPDIIQIAAVGPDDDVFNRSRQHGFHFRSHAALFGFCAIVSVTLCLPVVLVCIYLSHCLLFWSASVSATLYLSVVLVCICLSHSLPVSCSGLHLSLSQVSVSVCFASLTVYVLHSLSLWLSVLHHSLSQPLSVRQSVLNLSQSRFVCSASLVVSVCSVHLSQSLSVSV